MQTTARRGNSVREEFTCEVKKIIRPLSERNEKGWRKELNLVSFNGGEPKYDVRSWDPDHIKMSKGVSFTLEELKELAAAVEEL